MKSSRQWGLECPTGVLLGPVLKFKGRSSSMERLDMAWEGPVSWRIVREDPSQSLEIICGVRKGTRLSWAMG